MMNKILSKLSTYVLALLSIYLGKTVNKSCQVSHILVLNVGYHMLDCIIATLLRAIVDVVLYNILVFLGS